MFGPPLDICYIDPPCMIHHLSFCTNHWTHLQALLGVQHQFTLFISTFCIHINHTCHLHLSFPLLFSSFFSCHHLQHPDKFLEAFQQILSSVLKKKIFIILSLPLNVKSDLDVHENKGQIIYFFIKQENRFDIPN